VIFSLSPFYVHSERGLIPYVLLTFVLPQILKACSSAVHSVQGSAPHVITCLMIIFVYCHRRPFTEKLLPKQFSQAELCTITCRCFRGCVSVYLVFTVCINS
jgi:hypothetical protein